MLQIRINAVNSAVLVEVIHSLPVSLQIKCEVVGKVHVNASCDLSRPHGSDVFSRRQPARHRKVDVMGTKQMYGLAHFRIGHLQGRALAQLEPQRGTRFDRMILKSVMAEIHISQAEICLEPVGKRDLISGMEGHLGSIVRY